MGLRDLDIKEAVDSTNITLQVQSMTVAEKVRFALKAGKEARAVLIKDPNKQVAMAVATCPKITENEIVQISQSKNVDSSILRVISKNKDWVKRNHVCIALASNPKTPLDIAHLLLPNIKTKDLGAMCKNRNVPAAIRAAANRLFINRQR